MSDVWMVTLSGYDPALAWVARGAGRDLRVLRVLSRHEARQENQLRPRAKPYRAGEWVPTWPNRPAAEHAAVLAALHLDPDPPRAVVLTLEGSPRVLVAPASVRDALSKVRPDDDLLFGRVLDLHGYRTRPADGDGGLPAEVGVRLAEQKVRHR